LYRYTVAGVAAEAMAFEEVQGQEADLFDLQRILNKTAGLYKLSSVDCNITTERNYTAEWAFL
jgi:hypothetical protein